MQIIYQKSCLNELSMVPDYAVFDSQIKVETYIHLCCILKYPIYVFFRYLCMLKGAAFIYCVCVTIFFRFYNHCFCSILLFIVMFVEGSRLCRFAKI